MTSFNKNISACAIKCVEICVSNWNAKTRNVVAKPNFSNLMMEGNWMYHTEDVNYKKTN